MAARQAPEAVAVAQLPETLDTALQGKKNRSPEIMKLMNEALIIFVRRPAFGKVKTRLAATLGNEAALKIYRLLLQHTFNITAGLKADKFVFYADVIDEQDMWSAEGFYKMLQADAGLGLKMQTAFSEVFSRGYQKAVIIGSDCFELTTHLINQAFEMLDKNDIVIGPARDGGYYLLGMKQLYPALFENKKWSTATVLNDTLGDVAQLNLLCALLPQLTDIDEAGDVPEEWLTEINT
jgi:uncharacterized protein